MSSKASRASELNSGKVDRSANLSSGATRLQAKGRTLPSAASHDKPVTTNSESDLFRTERGRERILRGTAIYSGAPRLAELAVRIGFDTVWIEMEHGPTDYAVAEHICMATEVAGRVPTVRVSDGQRHHVLRALEIGARIVVVPMVQTAEQARQIVEHEKFPPVRSRGFNLRSRGVNYGLGDEEALFAQANTCTHLFAQIETMESVGNLDAICAVEGLSGVFIGPRDLSVSAGMIVDLNGDGLIAIVTDCVRRTRSAGKHAGILVSPGRMLEAAIGAGCDLVFFCGDESDLSGVWKRLLASVPAKVATQGPARRR